MKRTIFILLMALLSSAPLMAQSPCYKAKFDKGKELYNKGEFVKAKSYFNEARTCPEPDEEKLNEWIDKCNKMIAEAERKAEKERQRLEQERYEAERRAREEAKQRELAEKKRREREEAERKRLEKEARTRDSIATVQRQKEKEENERKRKREEEERRRKSQPTTTTTSPSYKTTYSYKSPWEYSFGGGIGIELRGFNSGNMYVDANRPGPDGLGYAVNLNGFFALRKYFGKSDYFFMASCAASLGLSQTPVIGVKTTYYGYPITVQYFDNYVFPHIAIGMEMDRSDWAVHMGAGYYMDLMFGASANSTVGTSWTSGSVGYDATLMSHFTRGWAGVLGFNNADSAGAFVRLLVGFPKSVDCMVEGYECRIKAPVIIISIGLADEWKDLGK